MVEENLYIRRASIDDTKLLSELGAVTFYDTFTGTCTDEDMQEFIEIYFNKKQVQDELKDPNDFYFIAFIDEVAVGYIRMKEAESDVAIVRNNKSIELKRIYVLKEYHSKKVGAGLMQFAIDFAAENGYKLLWLGVWEHNEKAIRFYKKFGFEDTGIQHPFPIGKTPQTDNWLIRFIEKPGV